MPSNYGEGFPRGILEAICLGIPVIATKNAGAENFDDSNVFLINNNEVKTIYNAVNKIKDFVKKDQLTNYLLNAKLFVEKNYTEEIIVRYTLSTYFD